MGSGHAAVTLHDNRVMLISGYPAENYRSVIIFDPRNNTFVTGPTLNFNKLHAAVTIFNSPYHDNRPVVLAAGGNSLAVAEILDYTTSSAWEIIDPLPTDYHTAFS